MVEVGCLAMNRIWAKNHCRHAASNQYGYVALSGNLVIPILYNFIGFGNIIDRSRTLVAYTDFGQNWASELSLVPKNCDISEVNLVHPWDFIAALCSEMNQQNHIISFQECAYLVTLCFYCLGFLIINPVFDFSWKEKKSSIIWKR